MGFIEDIELLKSKRIIRKDKDISDRTGYKKSTVSNYLSGKVPPSKPFLDKFYEVYSSDLGVNKVPAVNSPADLEKEILRLREQVSYKDAIIDAQKKALALAEHIIMKSNKTLSHATTPKKN